MQHSRSISFVGAAITGLLIVAIVCLLGGLPTMLLWNWLMPTLFSMKTITFLQALGLNFLSACLFKSGYSK